MPTDGTAPIRLVLNGERVDVAGVSPQSTLLAWLRDARQLTGTKEGCAEGDCGACTVVVAESRGDGCTDSPLTCRSRSSTGCHPSE